MSVDNSSPTFSSFAFDVPEPKNLSGDFLYHYFVKNESISNDPYSDTQAWIRHGGKPDVAGAPASTGTPAREIKLSFTPFRNITNLSPSAAQWRREAWLKNDASKIMSEVQVQTQRTCFLSLQDDNLADELQSIVDSELIKQKVESRGLSPLEAALKYNSITSDKINADDILEVTNIEANSNLTYYDPVSGKDVTVQKLAGASEYSVGCFLNRKFVSDILEKSESTPFSPLWGTVSSVLTEAKSIQDEATYTLDSNQGSFSDYSFTARPVHNTIVTSNSYPASVEPVGYIIFKYELEPSGNLVELESIVISDENLSCWYDKSVVYGKTYRYKIQSVFKLATSSSSFHEAENNINYNHYLIGSRSTPYIDVICKESVPPPPPINIEFFLSSNQKMMIFWDMPFNKQEDIKRFQIFRREKLEDPYTLINELDFDDSLVQIDRSEKIPDYSKTKLKFSKTSYEDFDFNFDKTYYYAICSVDAHDLSSPYSTQFKVKYSRIDGKMEARVIAFSGAPKPYPNFTLKQNLVLDCIKDSGHKSMKVYFDPECLILEGVKNRVETGDEVSIYRDQEKLLETNNEYPMYKLQVINLDWQQDKKINLYLKRASDLFENIDLKLPGE